MSDALIGHCRMIDLQVRGDERGSLIAIEAGSEAPFPIERVYYLFGTLAGVERGFHAHKKLQQLAVAVRGSCTMLLDDVFSVTDRRSAFVKADQSDTGGVKQS